MSEAEDARLFSPSVERNRGPIADALRSMLPGAGLVLEIASGSGEHALHLARAFPALRFQPSDPRPEARASIAAWRAAEGPANLLAPLDLDVLSGPDFPRADAVLCINMLHIAPWAATGALMAKSAAALAPGAPLILYGPFIRESVPTAEGNIAFDADLRARNPEWGIRRLEDVAAAAVPGFVPEQVHQMPANNLTVLFRRI